MKFDFLKESSDISSMRVSFFLITVACVVTLLTLGVYIVVKGFQETELTQWAQMGAFVAGVAAVIFGAGKNKKDQKKVEAGVE